MATGMVRQHGVLEYEPPRRVPVEEYLRLSAELPGTYEYHYGLMYPRLYPPGSTPGGYPAMAGGTRAHARLMVRMVAALEGHLRGGPCNVYPSDMRLYVAERSYATRSLRGDPTRSRPGDPSESVLARMMSEGGAHGDSGHR